MENIHAWKLKMRNVYLSNFKMIKFKKSLGKKISCLIEFSIWIQDRVKYIIRLLGQLLIHFLRVSMAQFLLMDRHVLEKHIQCKVPVLLILMSRELFLEW